MSRAERAKEYFLQGFACSQAVALAFADVMGIEEDTLKKLTLPFGGGMGRLRLTCGAVSGMAFVVGAVFAEGENNPENKKKTYAIVQELCGKFKEKTKSLICAELLAGMKVPVEIGGEAEKRTAEYYKKRSCADMVYLATEILENYLRVNGKL
ncbi:MAG: C_GCAxxG_C_C family protein [Clostridiales bacterium]|nr:C_GCAxxG_C_C family protein [Clostridiales bacterium]